MVMSTLEAKLMPTRFDGMSPLMAAIVGYVLGESCCQNLEFSSWNSVSAGLTPEERKEAVALFYSRVETLPGTKVG